MHHSSCYAVEKSYYHLVGETETWPRYKYHFSFPPQEDPIYSTAKHPVKYTLEIFNTEIRLYRTEENVHTEKLICWRRNGGELLGEKYETDFEEFLKCAMTVKRIFEGVAL